jgi:hypothetical protein
MDERDTDGYIVAYRRDDSVFPVIVMAMAAVGFVAAAVVSGAGYWLLAAVASAAGAYHNWPLLEKGRPTLGANQYGIFIQGLGLIRWRAVQRIDLIRTTDRSMTLHDLDIGLSVPIASALVTDWRKRPLVRQLMRLPWSQAAGSKAIRVNLDAFDRPAEEIHRTVLRMWRFYRS